jgi:CheY-like chemotaxis protein
MSVATSTPEILLVEDNAADVRLTIEAINDAKIPNHLVVARDGVEAMALLREGLAGVRPLPDLVLLDLNLPKKDGRELLGEIKGDPCLAHIPVVVLTTSRATEDTLHSYQLHANAVITKPLDVDRFFDVVKAIEQFWLQVVELPPSDARRPLSPHR